MFKYLLIFGFLSINVWAQAQDDVAQSKPVTALVYQPAKTSLDEARQYWLESDATILASGHLALGSGSGADNLSMAFDKDVDLVDVSGIEFEGVQTARFMFYKGVLYGIQANLQEKLFKKSASLNISDEALDALEKQLIKKYGKPHETNRSIYANGKKPDISIWHIKDNRLILSIGIRGASLLFMNSKIEKTIERNRSEVCK